MSRTPKQGHRAWGRIIKLSAAGAVGVLALGTGFFQSPSERAAWAAERESPSVILHVSGGAAGYLEACGCGRNPIGGIPRRASQIAGAKQRRPDARHYALEIGNFAAGGDAEGRLKSLGAISAMNHLDYVVSGVGERELARNQSDIRELVEAADFPFISANLVEASTGHTWLPPSVVITVGELDIGVSAVTRRNPSLVVPYDGDWITVRDPVLALRRHVRNLERRCDVLIVLAAVPVDEARRAAQQNPSIDLIIGSHGSFQTHRLLREGRTRIVYLGELGTHLAEVQVFEAASDGPAVRARLRPLDADVPPDQEMAQRMSDVLRQARQARLEARANASSSSRRRFVGSSACGECHPAILRDWADTAHARAFQVLRRGQDHFRTQCVSCHVTGFDQPGGFVDETRTAELASVGCEACHGPGASHVDQPRRPYGEVTLQTCVACHTNEMDPDFDYYRHRPEVSHRGVGDEE